MTRKFVYFNFITCLMAIYACNSGQPPQQNAAAKNAPAASNAPRFNADSAYRYAGKQTAFGARVPNTPAHVNCGNYLVAELQRFGANVAEQKMTLEAYNGDKLSARNIIGSFNQQAKNRIMLFAHWDSRPYADHDANPANHRTAVLGANDGASGVGVLMEIARQLGMKHSENGVDILFFDAEDYGKPAFDNSGDNDDTWCLGSQYWAQNPHIKGYTAKFGILLDMVGARNAVFAKEGFSLYYARRYVEKIWQTAAKYGYASYFANEAGGFVTDDHLYVSKLAGIPSVNIIQHDKLTDSGFYEHWHTINDSMEHLSKETLQAVGQTLLEVIYIEK